MPYISTKTNIELVKDKQDALAAKYGKIITLVPGKTERWLMLSFDDNAPMYFGGKSDEPMAYIELSLFGGASDSVYDKLTAAICDACPQRRVLLPRTYMSSMKKRSIGAGTARISDTNISKYEARTDYLSVRVSFYGNLFGVDLFNSK